MFRRVLTRIFRSIGAMYSKTLITATLFNFPISGRTQNLYTNEGTFNIDEELPKMKETFHSMLDTTKIVLGMVGHHTLISRLC